MSPKSQTTSTTKVEKTKDRIKQLLALAANTPYPEEAATAQEQAERLMVRYGIEQAELDNGSNDVVMVHGSVTFTSSDYGLALLRGMSAFVRAYQTVEVLQSDFGRSGGKTIHLVGAKSDVDMLTVAVESLSQQAMVGMKVWWKGYDRKDWLTRQERWLARREYLMQFGYGAADRVREMTREAVAESTGTDLVLVDRQAAAKAAAEAMFAPKEARAGRMDRGSYAAQTAGRRDGREASISVGRELGEG